MLPECGNSTIEQENGDTFCNALYIPAHRPYFPHSVDIPEIVAAVSAGSAYALVHIRLVEVP